VGPGGTCGMHSACASSAPDGAAFCSAWCQGQHPVLLPDKVPPAPPSGVRAPCLGLWDAYAPGGGCTGGRSAAAAHCGRYVPGLGRSPILALPRPAGTLRTSLRMSPSSAGLASSTWRQPTSTCGRCTRRHAPCCCQSRPPGRACCRRSWDGSSWMDPPGVRARRDRFPRPSRTVSRNCQPRSIRCPFPRRPWPGIESGIAGRRRR
jgi:hypothetical protein